jgi:hypothetical protein
MASPRRLAEADDDEAEEDERIARADVTGWADLTSPISGW